LMNRVIYVGEPIDDEVANRVIAQLLYLDNQDRQQDAVLYINSPGGLVTGALAIRDTMSFVGCQVSTICPGQAAGVAAMLLACGVRGKRFAAPHAKITLVRLRDDSLPPGDDIETRARERARLSEAMIETFVSCTGRSAVEIHAAMQRDAKFTAEQAKGFGLIDEVDLRRPWER